MMYLPLDGVLNVGGWRRMKKTIAKHDKPIASFEFANAISQSKKGFGLHSLMLCKYEKGASPLHLLFSSYTCSLSISVALFSGSGNELKFTET